ncbi:uncharacterized protein LOC114334005 isoform X2 [Diabrotica virgifera virgifera]|uniref:Uncharacterized protein LOC114334005 isoform X2 n=1 Tax=Diabrotica virgifera virgifera TaxID=50390 RepID=A0A6P7FU15_DIAVI|nr:uncharacterized protein LOC114334005 isoform X2 [Diabrotica virgifera virgifera]
MEQNARLPMYTLDKELASAFQIDCEDLLNEFESYQSFRIQDFQKVWHNQKFSYVFATWVKIRLTSEEYEKIHGLILEMVNKKVYEPVYMFSKLKADEAFTYVCQRKPLGPEDRFVKDFHLYINDTFVASKTSSALTKFKNSFGSTDMLFNKLKETSTEYSQLMHKFAEKCPDITPFSSNLVRDIETANLLLLGQDKKPEEKLVKEERTPVYNIKQRAMANTNAVYRANRNVISGVDLDIIGNPNGQDANDASS